MCESQLVVNGQTLFCAVAHRHTTTGGFPLHQPPVDTTSYFGALASNGWTYDPANHQIETFGIPGVPDAAYSCPPTIVTAVR